MSFFRELRIHITGGHQQSNSFLHSLPSYTTFPLFLSMPVSLFPHVLQLWLQFKLHYYLLFRSRYAFPHSLSLSYIPFPISLSQRQRQLWSNRGLCGQKTPHPAMYFWFFFSFFFTPLLTLLRGYFPSTWSMNIRICIYVCIEKTFPCPELSVFTKNVKAMWHTGSVICAQNMSVIVHNFFLIINVIFSFFRLIHHKWDIMQVISKIFIKAYINKYSFLLELSSYRPI